MADTKGHASVADLVLKLRTNIDSIHTTLSALTTTSSAHHAELERLSVEREKKIAELRASHEIALKELAAQRENEAASLIEQRRREQEELEIERQKEYDELMTKRKLEDEEREKALQEKEAERLRALQEEDAKREAEMDELERSLHEKVERELELLEDEMEQKVAEGRQALRDLDEKRKAINAEIDAVLNTPSVIPPVVFRSRSKTQKGLSNGINGTNGSNGTTSPFPESVVSDMQTIPEVESEKEEHKIENVEIPSSDELSSVVNGSRDIHIEEEGAHAPTANGLETEAIVPSSIDYEHIDTSEDGTELPVSQDSTHEASEEILEDKEVREEISEPTPANIEHETSREILSNGHQDSASVEHANSEAHDAPELGAIIEHTSAIEDETSNHEVREITEEILQDIQEPIIAQVEQIETNTEPVVDSTTSEIEDDQNSASLPKDLDITEEEDLQEEPIKEDPIESEPIDSKPIEEASIEEASIEEASIEEASIEEASIEEASIASEPIEEASIEEASIEEETVQDRDMATDLAVDHTDQETEITPQHHILESLTNHAVAASVEKEISDSELPSLESRLEDHTTAPEEVMPIDLEDKTTVEAVDKPKDSAAEPETSSIQAEDESPEDITRDLDLDVADVPNHASQPLSEDLSEDVEDHEKAEDALKSEPSSPRHISEEHSNPETLELDNQVEDNSLEHVSRDIDLEVVNVPSPASQPPSEDLPEDGEKAEDTLRSEPSSPKHISEEHSSPEPLDLDSQVEDNSLEHESRDLDLEASNVPIHASQPINEDSPVDVEDGEKAEDAPRSEPSSPKHVSTEHLSPEPLDLDTPEASLDQAPLVQEDPNIDQDKDLSSGEVETTDLEHITHDQSKEVPDSPIEEAIEDPSQELGLSENIVEALEAADDREVLSEAEDKPLDKSHALGDESIDVAACLPAKVESKTEVDDIASGHEILDEDKGRDEEEVAPKEFSDDIASEAEILTEDKAHDEDKAQDEEEIAPKEFLDDGASEKEIMDEEQAQADQEVATKEFSDALSVEILSEDKAQDDHEVATKESSDDITLEEEVLAEAKAQDGDEVAIKESSDVINLDEEVLIEAKAQDNNEVIPGELSDENVSPSKVLEHVVNSEAVHELEEYHHSTQDVGDEQESEASKSIKDESLDKQEEITHHSVAEVDSESSLADASHDIVLKSQTDDTDLEGAAPSAIASAPIEQDTTSIIEQPSSPETKAQIDTTSEPEDGESIYDEFPQSDTEERSVINELTDGHSSTPEVEEATSSPEDEASIHDHDSLATVEEDQISKGLTIDEDVSKPSHTASEIYQSIDQEDNTKDISSDDDFESAFSDGGSPSPRYDQVVEEYLSHTEDLDAKEYLDKDDTSTEADVSKESSSQESNPPTASAVEGIEITQDAEIPVQHSIDEDSPLTKSLVLDSDEVLPVTPTTSIEDDSSETKEEAEDTTPRIESFSAIPTAVTETETEIESEADITLVKDSLVKEDSHTEETPNLEVDSNSGHEEDSDLVAHDKIVDDEETHKELSQEILLDQETTRGSTDLELEPSSDLTRTDDDIKEAIDVIETSSSSIEPKHDSVDTGSASVDVPLSEVTQEDNNVNNAIDFSEASSPRIEPKHMDTDSESTHDHPSSELTHASSDVNKAIDIVEVSSSSNEPKGGSMDTDSKVTVNIPSSELTQEDDVNKGIDIIKTSSSSDKPKHDSVDTDPEPTIDIPSSELPHGDSDVDRAIDISEASGLSIEPKQDAVDTDPKPTASISLSELTQGESSVNKAMDISKTSSSSIEPEHASLKDSETTVDSSPSDLPLVGSDVVHVINTPSSSIEPKHDSIVTESEPAANLPLSESTHAAHTDIDVIKAINIVEAPSSSIEPKHDSIVIDSEPNVRTPSDNTSDAQDTQLKTLLNSDLIVSGHHDSQDKHDDAQEDSRELNFDAESLKSDDTIHATTANDTASFPSSFDEDTHKDDLADIHDQQEGARLSAFSSREVLVERASLDHKVDANASSSVDKKSSTLATDGSSPVDVFKFLEPEQHETPEAEADDTLDEGSSKDGVPLNGSTGPLDQGGDQEKAVALDPHHAITVANAVNRSAESPVTVLHTDDETETETDSDSSDVTEEEESGAEAEDEEEESEEEDEETYDSEGSGSDEEEESDDPVPAPLPSKTERHFPHVIQAMPSYEFGKPMLDPFSEGSNEQFDFPSSRSSGLYSSLVSNLKSDPVVKQMGNNGGSRSPQFEDEYSPVSAATDIAKARRLVQNAFQKTDTEDDAPFHDSFSDHQPSNTHSRSYTADTISSFGAQALSDGDSTVSETPSSPFQDTPRNEPVIASVHEHAEESRDIKTDLPLRAEFDPYGSNTYPKYITSKQTQDNLKAPIKSPRSSRNDRFVSQSIISSKSQSSSRGTPSPPSRRMSQAIMGERPFSPETRSVSYQQKRQSQEPLPSPTLKRSMTDKQLPVRGSFDPPSDSPIPTSTFFQKTRSLFEATSSQALPTVTRPLSGYFNGRGSPSPSPAPKLQKKGSMASLRSRPSSLYQHDLPVSEEEIVPKSLDGDGKPPSPAWSIPTAASVARSGSVSSQRSRERKSSHGSVTRVENDLNVWTPSKDIRPRSNNPFANAIGGRGERERVPLLAGEERGDGGVGVNR